MSDLSNGSPMTGAQKTATRIILGLLLIFGIWVLYRTFTGSMSLAYVKANQVNAVINDDRIEHLSEVPSKAFVTKIDGKDVAVWNTWKKATPAEYAKAIVEDPQQEVVQFSLSNTLGIWVAAFFTLAIMSFLWCDNPFYKIAESIFVGVSAAYWMVVGYWDVVVPNLFGKLAPGWTQSWAIPDLEVLGSDWLYLVPLIFSVMLVWRLVPVGGWISRWPLGFIIGTTAGLRMFTYLKADFVGQIAKMGDYPLIVSKAVLDPVTQELVYSFSIWDSFMNVLMVIGVFTCLVYFFFSVEHKGLMGGTARVGIWYLMITFGAAFGYTVMGRVALLVQRFEFLFNDWLWLVDPFGARAGF